MYPETHSQYDEEHAILKYFADRYHIAEGAGYPSIMRFLDVGAWDPITFSNTRALFERGWSGVVIEPSPTPLLALVKAYGGQDRVQVVNTAVGLESIPMGMWVTDDSVSTSNEGVHETWKEKGGYFGRMTVVPLTWPQINNWFGGFNFVNIDAEGLSVDLFRAMLDSGQIPECCCVEHDGRLVELGELATKRGYRMLYSNGTNAVFGR